MSRFLPQARRRAATTADVADALQRGLRPSRGAAISVVAIERRDSMYATSFVIENLDVELSDGTALRVVFKDVGRTGLMDQARRVKPSFLYDPLREIQTYRTILSDTELGTAACYATVADVAQDRYWLFLERVPGVELYQVGELDTWRQVAGWLARMHDTLWTQVERSTAVHDHLVHHDASFYRRWSARAVCFAQAAGVTDEKIRRLEGVSRRYDRVIEQLVATPVTVIHGEFYASNVLVARDMDGLRVCPVDWETTARGPGVIDLAALTAGPWSAADRSELVLAYRDALCASGSAPLHLNDLEVLLDCARLHLALQWLGWSPDWTPPAAHAYDWLAEVFELAERLAL